MIPSGYTKLFGSIVASTVWREDDKTRIVWVTMLALSDKDGYVAGSVPGLADLARVSVEDCEKALDKLQRPDRYSRSQEHDGRRIQQVEGGWLVLNRVKYRDLVPDERRRELDRIRQRRHRQKKEDVTRDSHAPSRMSLQKEKEEEEEKEEEKEEYIKPSAKSRGGSSSPSKPDSRHNQVRDFIRQCYEKANPSAPAMPWNGQAGRALDNLLKENTSWTAEKLCECVVHRFESIANHAEEPSRWIPKLLGYAAGPLDKYGKPKAANNGKLSLQQIVERETAILSRSKSR